MRALTRRATQACLTMKAKEERVAKWEEAGVWGGGRGGLRRESSKMNEYDRILIQDGRSEGLRRERRNRRDRREGEGTKSN